MKSSVDWIQRHLATFIGDSQYVERTPIKNQKASTKFMRERKQSLVDEFLVRNFEEAIAHNEIKHNFFDKVRKKLGPEYTFHPTVQRQRGRSRGSTANEELYKKGMDTQRMRRIRSTVTQQAEVVKEMEDWTFQPDLALTRSTTPPLYPQKKVNREREESYSKDKS